MPRRPRPHQLEDISRQSFRALLPAPWVARDKSHDYGIDVEVEVFDEEGFATGLSFLVQLRATDVAAQATKLSLNLTQLGYYSSLDLPVLIVRYCSVDGSWHCRWCFNVDNDDDDAKRKSITIRFDQSERWDADTPGRIGKTLATLRKLRSYPSARKVVLVPSNDGATYDDLYRLEQACAWLGDNAPPVAARRSAESTELEISAVISPGRLRVAIDCKASITLSLPQEDESLRHPLLYALAALLYRVGLQHQASLVAQTAVSLQATTSIGALALQAALALASDLPASVGLAILNGLHRNQGPEYVAYLMFLKAVPQPVSAQKVAETAFLSASLAHAEALGEKVAQAAVRYSMGNACRFRGESVQALRHFNAARRLRPDYMRASYFLVEVAGTLFEVARYRLAAAFYRVANDIDESSILKLFLADTLLFSGFVDVAIPLFRAVGIDGPSDRRTEAYLKAEVCEWLIDAYGKDHVSVRRNASNEALLMLPEANEPSTEVLHGLLLLDAFSDFANFNQGIARISEGRRDDALAHFLICAFRQSGDHEAWMNAAIVAFGMDNPLLLAAVMDCAHRMGGPGVYPLLRKELVRQNMPAEAIEAWDDVNRTLAALAPTAAPTMTFRVLAPDAVEPMIELTTLKGP